MKKVLLLLLTVAFAASMFATGTPRAFSGEVDGNAAIFTWLPPAEGVIGWDTGEISSSFGIANSPFTASVGTRFAVEDLVGFDQMIIESVSIGVGAATGTYTIKIWQGGGSVNGDGTMNAGTLVNEQAVTQTIVADSYNVIPLTVPHVIDGNQELWISYDITSTPGYPLAYDTGEKIAGKSDLMFQSATTAKSFAALPASWCIRGILADTSTRTGGERVVLSHDENINYTDASLFENNVNFSTASVNTTRNTRVGEYTFNLYRNNEVVKTFDSANSLLKVDFDLAPGTYNYKVTAVKEGVESDPTETIQLTIADDVLNAPTALEGRVLNANNAYLEWNIPGQALPGVDALSKNTGEIGGNIIGGGNNYSYYAARFSTADLQAYNGQQLTQVAVGLAHFTYLKVVVWQGGSWTAPNATDLYGNGDPGNIVHEQWVWTPEENSINLVTLTAPVTIDASQELWIGYMTNGHIAESEFPCLMDAGPAVDGFGDLTSTDGGAFSSLHAQYNGDPAGEPDFNYNFMINGFVRDTNGAAVPMTRGLTGYKVYRDEVAVAEITNPQQNNFLDRSLPEGTYNYKVSAMYDSGESTLTDAVSVTTVAVPTLPPSGLSATLAGLKDVRLNWDLPNWSGAVESLKYDNGNVHQGISLQTSSGPVTSFTIAHRYEPADLTELSGHSLTYISFYAPTNGTYRVQAWQGGNYVAEQGEDPAYVNAGNLLVDQVVTDLLPGQWNKVMLYSPITIDASQELMIGAKIDENLHPDQYPGFSEDDAIATEFKGNLLSLNGQSFQVVSGIAGNSLVRGWTNAPATRNTRSIEGYKIYRNGNPLVTIDDINANSYLDENLDEGDYNYYMTALYAGGTESEASDLLDVTVQVPRPTIASFRPIINNGSVIVTRAAPENPPVDPTTYNFYMDGEIRATQTQPAAIITGVDQGRHSFWVTAVYGEGEDAIESGASEVYVIENFIVPTDGNEATPIQTAFKSIYPNPFNPSTTIQYDLKATSDVNVTVYNVKGQKVVTLVNERQNAGHQEIAFNGKDAKGNSIGSGIYFVKVNAGRYSSTKKMILLK